MSLKSRILVGNNRSKENLKGLITSGDCAEKISINYLECSSQILSGVFDIENEKIVRFANYNFYGSLFLLEEQFVDVLNSIVHFQKKVESILKLENLLNNKITIAIKLNLKVSLFLLDIYPAEKKKSFSLVDGISKFKFRSNLGFFIREDISTYLKDGYLPEEYTDSSGLIDKKLNLDNILVKEALSCNSRRAKYVLSSIKNKKEC